MYAGSMNPPVLRVQSQSGSKSTDILPEWKENYANVLPSKRWNVFIETSFHDIRRTNINLNS